MATATQMASTMSPFASEKQQPPAYTPFDATSSSMPSSTPSLHFPRSIKATYKSSWSKVVCSTAKEMALEPGSFSTGGNSFKLSLPGGYYGSLVLEHAQESGPPIARGIPGDRRTYEIIFDGSTSAELLKRKPRKNAWWFALPGPSGEIETFEWRRSHGSEIKQLGASWRGWKLVRLRNTDYRAQEAADDHADEKSLSDNSEVDNGQENDHQNGSASDGSEVVAVWAKSKGWSRKDVGELLFMGSGASGELGDRWAVMALMSSLCIWQKALRDQATMGAATSTSTVVVTS